MRARPGRRRLRPRCAGTESARSRPGGGYPRTVPLSTGQRLLRHDRRLGVRFVAGADEAGRGSLAGPLVVAGVLLDYQTLRGHRVRPLALLNDSKQVEPGRARAALPRRARGRVPCLGARDRLDRHRRPRPPPLEPVGPAHRPRRPPPARRGLPRGRVPARAARAASHSRRRRRHEERGDRRRLDRRQGDAGPADAPPRRALSAVRLLVPRRVHHAGVTRGPCVAHGPCPQHRRSFQARAYAEPAAA